MENHRTPEGRIEVTFHDRSTISATIYREGEEVYLHWIKRGSVPHTHLIHPKNKGHRYGWVRELSRIFNKKSKTYNYYSLQDKS